MSAERQRCRLCGSPVEVVSSDEGTSYYRPAEQGDIEVIREALEASLAVGSIKWKDKYSSTLAALDRIAAALENRKHTHSNLNVCIEQREELRAALERVERQGRLSQVPAIHREQIGRREAEARAEKAERALAEMTAERDAAWGIDRDGHRHGDPRWSMLEIEMWLRALGFVPEQRERVRAALRPSEEASDES